MRSPPRIRAVQPVSDVDPCLLQKGRPGAGCTRKEGAMMSIIKSNLISGSSPQPSGSLHINHFGKPHSITHPVSIPLPLVLSSPSTTARLLSSVWRCFDGNSRMTCPRGKEEQGAATGTRNLQQTQASSNKYYCL